MTYLDYFNEELKNVNRVSPVFSSLLFSDDFVAVGKITNIIPFSPQFLREKIIIENPRKMFPFLRPLFDKNQRRVKAQIFFLIFFRNRIKKEKKTVSQSNSRF